MVGRFGRWPSASTIRQLRAAIEAGESLKLGSRRLRYAVSFFGIATVPRPANISVRQWAARQNWARRKERLGESGVSEKGRHALMLNLVSADIAKRRIPKPTHCQRGHKWTAENTRRTSRGRSCRACERIGRGQRRLQRLELRRRQSQIREALKQMKLAGIKNHQDPASAYWRDRYVAARDRWQRLKSQAA